MSRATWLLDVIADAFRGVSGFQVDYIRGWESRGSSTFDPRGIINHHTGAGSYSALLNYMSEGSRISPLCNVATSRPINGIVRITIVAAGKANHAGRGKLPWTGKDMGNSRSIGFENQNDGKQSWPDQQNEAIARANLAVLKKLNLGVDRLADHKTYAPTRKVDRVHTDLASWQNYVSHIEGAAEMIASKGSNGPVVTRIQKDVNVLQTFHHLGPEKMSTQPRDQVGIPVDGDYGPTTAKGIRQVMKDLAGIDVSGEVFGSLEAYIFTRFGYYADDKRHSVMQNHGSGGSIDTSDFATKEDVKQVSERVDSLTNKYGSHRHNEGKTGPPS